jgi:HEPN domain-containing protein
MTMKRETQLWIERAEYDLVTADAMLQSARYLYVAFACQQAVEKYLKAIIQEASDTMPPFIHNLPALLKLTSVFMTDNQNSFLMLLTQYYLNTRYVDVKQKLLATMDKEKAAECLKKTQEIV